MRIKTHNVPAVSQSGEKKKNFNFYLLPSFFEEKKKKKK